MRDLALPDIPVRWNQKTIEYLRYFKDDPKGRSLIRAWLSRMGRYETEVRRIFKEVGVPEDLVFVAMVESGFRPDSTNSRTGAGGMWQFMEATGRVYGLMGDYWFDDRYDYVRAAYAAAAYFKDLKVRFGSWELALASYNAGYGLVMKAVRRNNTNNFWSLCEIEAGLPYQTTNYIPKLVAAAIVARNQSAFGLDDLKPRAPAILVEVNLPPATRLKDVAKAIDFDEEMLAQYNARLRRGRTPPKGGPFEIRIPKHKLAAFEKLDKKLKAATQPLTTHQTLLGEDLEMIAREYGITEKHLRKLNGIRESSEIHGGITLVVPKPPPPDSSGSTKPAPLPLAAVPPLSVPTGKRLVFFRTTRATTPRRLSSAVGISWDEIVAWNDIDPRARVLDELMLQLAVPMDFDGEGAGVRIFETQEVRHVVRGTQEHLDAILAQRELLRRGYKARKGDTLKKVAKRFKTSIGSLARINKFRRSHKLENGEVLIVYVAKAQLKGTIAAPPPVATTITAELAALAEDKAAPTQTRAPSTADTARVPGQDAKKQKK
jgi:membrane-bound lytic murein transglycosylase D